MKKEKNGLVNKKLVITDSKTLILSSSLLFKHSYRVERDFKIFMVSR